MRPTRRFAGVAAAVLLLGSSLCVVELGAESRPSFKPIHVVHVVAPVYPIRSVASGTVILRITITRLGAIDEIFVAQGVPSLTKECERAVRKWTFQPAQVDRRTVKSSTTAAFAFSDSPGAGRPRAIPSMPGTIVPFQPVRILSALGAIYPFGGFASGSVIFEVNVGESGAIDRIEVLKGIPSLTEAAERAVRKWKFEPARIDGKVVASSMIASFTFRVPPSTPATTMSH